MAIYRGIGGAGDSTTDATVTAVTEKAVEAAASAASASTSETNASNSASAASTSATNASNSASNASTSETNASNSASAASTSASNASTSETNAAASASAASTSETNAAASESAASTSETNAATSETNAATSESNAASSASAASTSASNAATSESNASTSETNAATSATNAATSETNAQTAADTALSALDNFDDRYLGQKASDPTLDNDGDALVAGALYFNTADDVMKVYDGSAWVAAYASLSGTLVAVNNLSDVASVSASRTNLGLGTAATTASTDYATAAQGALADSAVQTETNDLSSAVTWANVPDANITESSVTQHEAALSITESQVSDLGAYIENLVEDTTPQLGGDLASNGNNVNFGDGDKALFGAGNDLQIYHDGSHSIILDNGTGDLYIRASDNFNLQVGNGAGGWQDAIRTYDANRVDISYAGSVKLATTATGVDVTGTVTADGLTVDTNTLHVDATNNRVGIGTTSPTANLHVSSTGTPVFRIQDADGSDYYAQISQATGSTIFDTRFGASNGAFIFRGLGGGTADEYMRITSAGNVGIGTTSPSTALDVNGTVTATTVDLGDWTITESAGVLKFAHSGTDKMKLDSSGNLTVVGDVTAFGSI